MAASANLHGHPESAIPIKHRIVRAGHPFLVFPDIRLLFFLAVVVVLCQGVTVTPCLVVLPGAMRRCSSPGPKSTIYLRRFDPRRRLSRMAYNVGLRLSVDIKS